MDSRCVDELKVNTVFIFEELRDTNSILQGLYNLKDTIVCNIVFDILDSFYLKNLLSSF